MVALQTFELRPDLKHLLRLTPAQQQQVLRQLEGHQHQRYERTIRAAKDIELRNFVVFPHVIRPDEMSSIALAHFVCSARELVANKTVLDMGSGAGIQGIIAARCGARRVYLSDVSDDAVYNSSENAERTEVQHRCSVLKGDLFEAIEEDVETIIFNHPFFADDPIPGIPVSSGMLDRGPLLRRFLRSAKRRLLPDGQIIMPFLDLAGTVNHPALNAARYGYVATELAAIGIRTGLQSGSTLSVYLLRPATTSRA